MFISPLLGVNRILRLVGEAVPSQQPAGLSASRAPGYRTGSLSNLRTELKGLCSSGVVQDTSQLQTEQKGRHLWSQSTIHHQQTAEIMSAAPAARLAAATAVVLVCVTCLHSTVALAQILDLEDLAEAPAPAPAGGSATGLSIPPFAGILLMSFLSFWVSCTVNFLFAHSK